METKKSSCQTAALELNALNEGQSESRSLIMESSAPTEIFGTLHQRVCMVAKCMYVVSPAAFCLMSQ